MTDMIPDRIKEKVDPTPTRVAAGGVPERSPSELPEPPKPQLVPNGVRTVYRGDARRQITGLSAKALAKRNADAARAEEAERSK